MRRHRGPIIISRAKLRLSMPINPSFHQRIRSTTQLRAPCSDPSVTTSARRSVPCPDVVTGWSEGNHSLTPVRAPSHTSVHHPPPWWRVAQLTFNFTQESLFFFSQQQIPTLPTPTILTFTCVQVLWCLACLTRHRASGVTTRPATTSLTVFSTRATQCMRSV